MYIYIFTGTVNPERMSLTVPNVFRTVYKEQVLIGTAIIKVDIKFNQISVTVESTDEITDLATLRISALQSANAMLSCYATETGRPFVIDIRQLYCVNSQRYLFYTEGLPAIGPKDTSKIDISSLLQAANNNSYFRHAVNDFRSALSMPYDTGFFCYRAYESLILDVMKSNNIGKNNKPAGIIKILHILSINDECATYLKSLNVDVRHGHPVSITADERRIALLIVQAMLKRYAEFFNYGKKFNNSNMFDIPV